LVQEHRFNFGLFDVSGLLQSNERFQAVKDSDGNVIPFQVKAQEDSVWWGQPSGYLRVEIGVKDGVAYLLEGDFLSFGRKSMMDSEGNIAHDSTDKQVAEIMKTIQEQLPQYIVDKFRDYNFKADIRSS